MQQHTTVTLVRFEEDTAILQFSDGTETTWPKPSLPDDAQIGSLFSLVPTDQAHDPKELLNELLKEEE